MSQILFRNLSLLDPKWDEPRGGYEVLVEGGTIKEVSSKPIKSKGARTVDCGKRTLMPGLIDSHVHVFLTEVNIRHLEAIPLTLMTAKSSELMRGMIDRGFTSVRDTGGADWGIKTAVEIRPDRGAASLHLRQGDRPDRRPRNSRRRRQRLPAGALRLLQRHGLCHGRGRRRRRSYEGRFAGSGTAGDQDVLRSRT